MEGERWNGRKGKEGRSEQRREVLVYFGRGLDKLFFQKISYFDSNH